mmetsp:Transcript_49498/g.99609  ORF Transcript_49498/g.99609 Transcript_49498/m.99609 type:complete len:219 (+) Transcript_49498:1994-2650(+)
MFPSTGSAAVAATNSLNQSGSTATRSRCPLFLALRSDDKREERAVVVVAVAARKVLVVALGGAEETESDTVALSLSPSSATEMSSAAAPTPLPPLPAPPSPVGSAAFIGFSVCHFPPPSSSSSSSSSTTTTSSVSSSLKPASATAARSGLATDTITCTSASKCDENAPPKAEAVAEVAVVVVVAEAAFSRLYIQSISRANWASPVKSKPEPPLLEGKP